MPKSVAERQRDHREKERTAVIKKYGLTKEGRERMGGRVEKLLWDHPRYAYHFDQLLRRINRELKGGRDKG
jgi:hypothetical protein